MAKPEDFNRNRGPAVHLPAVVINQSTHLAAGGARDERVADAESVSALDEDSRERAAAY